jgi:hypothetical protein
LNHVSLIRPLDDAIKIRITKDLTELEYIFSNFFQSQSLDLSLLEEYSPLREFRALLFNNPSEINPSELKLDYYLVCHHLICRTDDIRLPCQIKGWSQTTYCDWIDANPTEIVGQLNKCLDEYASSIISRGESLYCEEYPVLRSILASVTK